MTEKELHRLASLKPVLTDDEVMDYITEHDIEVMTEIAWRKCKIMLAKGINESENADDWMTPDEYEEYLKDKLKRIYEK